MTVTVSTTTIEKVIQEQVKTYTLELSETEFIEIVALLSCCAFGGSVYGRIRPAIPEDKRSVYAELGARFSDCFEKLPKLS
jgi:hypothetical protein